MSISASLNNALSGLTASSRAAALVSSNVSNAMTEGYGRRELSLSARQTMGVTVDGVVRVVDQAVIADRQLADAALGFDDAVAGFFTELERILGAPGDPASLPGRIASFDAALIEAAARPDSQSRLAGLLSAAQSAADGFEDASDSVQALRMDADRRIATQVERLNQGVANVASINEQILRSKAAGRDISALLDQRQQAIDAITPIVPIRALERPNGTVALITTNGAMLLDIKPAVVAFDPVGVITPQMTRDSGALSGLAINDFEISTSGRNAPLAGGTLAAAFDVRDDLAIEAQTRLDAVARDFIERFQDPAVDPTLAPGDAGLFTDGGAVFDSADELGLAARLSVNALVDPASGGALWRLRDGLGAPAEGPVGQNAQLVRLGQALGALRVPASGDLATGARSAPALAGDLLSMVSVDRQGADQRQGFSAARLESLRSLELETGVDTDQEMQKLLLIEQAYAANARVVTTVNDLIDTLLRI
jgi:flagellar hook-associated protein 1